MAAALAGNQMQNGLKIDGTMRALAIALGGAIATSVIAMFIPVSVFESITGATGFSELVPATGAPLGDTARALIAFGFGALAFAVLAGYLLRKPSKPVSARPAVKAQDAVEAAKPVTESAPSFVDRMRAKISDFTESRRNADAVTELSDLPKLRAGDAHPDAPPRRPISAHRDFGEVVSDMAEIEQPVIAVAAPDVAPVAVAEPVIELSAPQTDTLVAPAAADPASVAEMVDQLESAVAQREAQIAKLEALAKAEIAKPEVAAPATTAEVAPEVVVETPRQTLLEAVPSAPVSEVVDDEMDAALRSALETLHRMNVRTR
jgi:hypothetical protein